MRARAGDDFARDIVYTRRGFRRLIYIYMCIYRCFFIQLKCAPLSLGKITIFILFAFQSAGGRYKREANVEARARPCGFGSECLSLVPRCKRAPAANWYSGIRKNLLAAARRVGDLKCIMPLWDRVSYMYGDLSQSPSRSAYELKANCREYFPRSSIPSGCNYSLLLLLLLLLLLWVC